MGWLSKAAEVDQGKGIVAQAKQQLKDGDRHAKPSKEREMVERKNRDRKAK